VEQFKSFLQHIVPITETEFAEALFYFKELRLKKGDFFIEQGKVCKHIAFIQYGTLKTYYHNNKAEEITSCFCIANNFTTSYKSFILQTPSKQSIQAIEETQLLSIDFDSLQKLYAKSIVWQNIGRAFAEREYVVMEQYASILNHETAKEKYLRLLKEQPTVIQKASIKDIASYLGVTSRTLSRIRQEITK
jgi:CRP-like cAMP-binding protein